MYSTKNITNLDLYDKWNFKIKKNFDNFKKDKVNNFMIYKCEMYKLGTDAIAPASIRARPETKIYKG